jgi:hypothetical protein
MMMLTVCWRFLFDVCITYDVQTVLVCVYLDVSISWTIVIHH